MEGGLVNVFLLDRVRRSSRFETRLLGKNFHPH